MNRFLTVLGCVWLFGQSVYGQPTAILDSGGKITAFQASYDVKYYRLQLEIDPEAQSIGGSVTIQAEVVQPMEILELDLDTVLEVTSITGDGPAGEKVALKYVRDDGKVHVQLGRTYQPGESIEATVTYGGNPRIAPNPPWAGGFTWSKTPSGADWIATSCQGQGADIWWPCKDHVSDEPDSMDLLITVPTGLYAACNGVLRNTTAASGVTTYHWHISQPINIYTVALNIAPYELIEKTYTSVTGEQFPFVFYVLPEDVEKGREIMPEFMDHMRFFEETLGPYPFRADKYGVVQTPHLGMEHQTIIAYGANFDNSAMLGRDFGFDALHHHELSHEWWGNLVTNSSWEDVWIHEGFGSYMQALYCERIGGEEAYYNYMRFSNFFTGALFPVAPRETKTAGEAFRAPVYTKGAWILHTLRNYIGDEAFFAALRKMAYPDETHLHSKDGSQCRFVTTDDFQTIVEEETGLNMDWFFELYLRQAELPTLVVHRISDKKVKLIWNMPVDHPMLIPVEIRYGENALSEVIPEHGLILKVKQGVKLHIDPRKRILCSIAD